MHGVCQRIRTGSQTLSSLRSSTTLRHVAEASSSSSVCSASSNMKQFEFRGLMAPVFTPFKSTSPFELDLDILPAYADYLVERGITGILVNGTTGEGVSMTEQERRHVLECWLKVTKPRGMTVMAQIGGAPLTSVNSMCRHAESLGVDALLCLPDLFFRPRDEEELAEYLQHVARAAPSTPLLYYHIPAFTLLNLDMAVLMDKCEDRVESFAGVKFTHTDLEQGARCVHRHTRSDRRLSVFLGADQLTAGAWSLGFDSAISTTLNIYPELSQGIVEALRNRDTAAALQTQLELNRRIRLITSLGSWVGSMKAAMEAVTGLRMGPPRPPLTPVSVDAISKLGLSRDE